MRWVLFLLTIPVLFYGFMEFSLAETIWQQVLAAMFGLAAVMMFCTAAIIDAVVTLQKKMESLIVTLKKRMEWLIKPTRGDPKGGDDDILSRWQQLSPPAEENSKAHFKREAEVSSKIPAKEKLKTDAAGKPVKDEDGNYIFVPVEDGS